MVRPIEMTGGPFMCKTSLASVARSSLVDAVGRRRRGMNNFWIHVRTMPLELLSPVSRLSPPWEQALKAEPQELSPSR